MRIAIIGAGAVGSHYAARWVDAGHEVVLSYTRDHAALASRAKQLGARAATPADAVTGADVVVFSPPFELIADAAAEVGEVGGAIVIDTTNPFTPDRSGIVELPGGATAFTEVRSVFPRARLVKALHNLAIAQLADADRPVAFVAGDDAAARRTVSNLVVDAGLTAFETGGLQTATLSEAPGPLFMKLYTPAQAEEAVRALSVEFTRA